MRPLSATLKAAQATHTAPPLVELTVDDRHLGAPRYHFVPVRDNLDPAMHAAACCWGSYLGFLSCNTISQLYFYRFAAGDSPGAPLTVNLGGAITPNSQPALIHDGSTLRAWHVATDAHRIFTATSADDGATWSAWSLVHDFGTGYACSGLAAVATPGTLCSWVLLVAVRNTTTGVVTVHTLYDIGGAVSGPHAWPRPAAALNEGLAAVHVGGTAAYTRVLFFYAGQAEGTTDNSLHTYQLDVQASLRFWIRFGSTNLGEAPGFAWRWPAACNVPGDRTYVLAQETSPSGATYPVLISLLPTGAYVFVAPGTLRRPLPPEGTRTLALAASSAGLHLGHPGHIRHAPLYTSAARVDLTPYLISYDLWDPLFPWESPRLGKIVLGAHSDFLHLPSALDLGAMLTLREGYETSAGPEYSPAPQIHVAEITRDPHTITLGVYDALGALARTPAQFTAKLRTSPSNTLWYIHSLLGMPFADDGSPYLFTPGYAPTYLIQSGAPLLAPVRRVLEHTGTALIAQPQEATLDAYPALQGYAFTPPTGTAGAYAFGPDLAGGQHRILSWQVDDAETPAWYIAMHEATYAEEIDLDTANRLAFARQLVREEALADHLAPALIAPLLAARYAAGAHVGRITTRPHVGAEPGDIVQIDAAPLWGYRRILAIRRQYHRERQEYTHTYTLGAIQ